MFVMKSMYFLSAALVGLSAPHAMSAPADPAGAERVKTVETLDLNRFLGRWYEIARFDHRFERGMECVTAEYAMRPDGMVAVTNSGYKKGKFRVAHAKAKQPDPADPGKLKVSFFLWFYSDYYVLALDSLEYAYALVGSSYDKYLWILSRTPKLDPVTLEYLLEQARRRAYDTSKLIWVRQKER